MKTNLLPNTLLDLNLPGTEARVGDTVQIVGDSAPHITPLRHLRRQTGIMEAVHFLGLSSVRIHGKPVLVFNLRDLRVIGSREIPLDEWMRDAAP